MASAIVIGDGPGGLSAALFLAKKGVKVDVFGKNETAMHSAMLYNYLGIPAMTGSEFQRTAREQVASFGARLHDQRVSALEQVDGGFAVVTEDGARYTGQYVVIAEGKGMKLAASLGLSKSEGGVEVDQNGRTAIDGLYVVGRTTRINRSQAIISAGAGATAALDILAREAGKDVRDYDTVPEDD
jgi:thioredoxin reductase (NADPH)